MKNRGALVIDVRLSAQATRRFCTQVPGLLTAFQHEPITPLAGLLHD